VDVICCARVQRGKWINVVLCSENFRGQFIDLLNVVYVGGRLSVLVVRNAEEGGSDFVVCDDGVY